MRCAPGQTSGCAGIRLVQRGWNTDFSLMVYSRVLLADSVIHYIFHSLSSININPLRE